MDTDTDLIRRIVREEMLNIFGRCAVTLAQANQPAPPAEPVSPATPVTAPSGDATKDGMSADLAPQAILYTYDDVRQAVMSYQDRHGEKQAKALLKLHGATYIKELRREDYAKIMAECAA